MLDSGRLDDPHLDACGRHICFLTRRVCIWQNDCAIQPVTSAAHDGAATQTETDLMPRSLVAGVARPACSQPDHARGRVWLFGYCGRSGYRQRPRFLCVPPRTRKGEEPAWVKCAFVERMPRRQASDEHPLGQECQSGWHLPSQDEGPQTGRHFRLTVRGGLDPGLRRRGADAAEQQLQGARARMAVGRPAAARRCERPSAVGDELPSRERR
jgi:hypothetical protein